MHILTNLTLLSATKFSELKDWWLKLLLSVRRTEWKESEFTKSSSAIWSAAN